jgi:NAD(P)-dependent dehydrogenase (short-subunit alcohol dehydrogenase family)
MSRMTAATTTPSGAPAIAPWDIGLYGTRTAGGKPYVAAVVGAASGIGRAAAAFLADIGCAVAGLDPATGGLKSLAAEKPPIRVYRMDALDSGSILEAVAAVTRDLGPIDALVNCAGITGTTNIPAHEVPLADFDRVVALNLRAALVLSQAVLPGMLQRRYGRLLHVASIAGKEGNQGMASYSATKAGLIGLVKSMGKDYAESGVTVNALAPAVIRTPLVEALPQATVDYMTQRIPMHRCGELMEAAACIAWIISPACGFTTGFTFDLSGGRATY